MNKVDNLSLIFQALSLQILFEDYNNSDLMNELQTQDEKYLKQILKNQEEILQILKKGSEKVIDKKDRTIEYLKDTVKSIYKAIRQTLVFMKKNIVLKVKI